MLVRYYYTAYNSEVLLGASIGLSFSIISLCYVIVSLQRVVKLILLTMSVYILSAVISLWYVIASLQGVVKLIIIIIIIVRPY